MNTVYCDESGNTGAALLDPAQPAFALASNDFTTEEAKTLLELVQSNAAEPKFSALKGSTKGVEKILAFLAHELVRSERIVITVDHKEYMVVTKIVDMLVENLAYDDGIDLYERGGNIAEANLMYYATRALSDKKAFGAMLSSFVVMVRRPGRETIERFYYWAWKVFKSLPADRRSIFAPVVASQRIIDEVLKNNDPTSIDPAVTNVVQHCHEWGRRYGTHFHVVHDRSKPVAAEANVFEAFMDKSVEPKLIGYDRRKFWFPLLAETLTFAESHVTPQLQVSDLLAGAAMTMAMAKVTKANTELAGKLEAAGLQKLLSGILWPSPEVDPKKLGTDEVGGINAVEFMADFLQNRGPLAK